MNWKPWILPLLVAGGLASIYLLPKAGAVAESAVDMELPGSLDGWAYQSINPSEAEVKTLGKHTGFAKAMCLKVRPGEFTDQGDLIPDRIDVSVVLSGYDMNTSIHRPERCMPAQGHSIKDSTSVSMTTDEGGEFPVRRLKSEQTLRDAEGKAVATFHCLTYYFFVGHDRITNDHLKRTLFDIEDRVVRGRDQRWAYVSASMWFGKVPWIENEITEQEADKKLQDFVRKFAAEQIDWNQIGR